jgi:hypothetical protein
MVGTTDALDSSQMEEVQAVFNLLAHNAQGLPRLRKEAARLIQASETADGLIKKAIASVMYDGPDKIPFKDLISEAYEIPQIAEVVSRRMATLKSWTASIADKPARSGPAVA